jgi:hypothetical protein
MTSNLFVIDSERLFEVLLSIIALSFLVERALAVLFENRWFVERYTCKGLKEPITVLVAFGVCRLWDFDALSIILGKSKSQLLGHLFTAAIIAGGSKSAVKLFHDVLDTMSSAERERQAQIRARASIAGHANAPAVATIHIEPQPGAPARSPSP